MPLPPRHLTSLKSRMVFSFLLPVYLQCPGKEAIKWVFVNQYTINFVNIPQKCLRLLYKQQNHCDARGLHQSIKHWCSPKHEQIYTQFPRHDFPPDISPTSIPWHFMDSCKIPGHFPRQVVIPHHMLPLGIGTIQRIYKNVNRLARETDKNRRHGWLKLLILLLLLLLLLLLPLLLLCNNNNNNIYI